MKTSMFFYISQVQRLKLLYALINNLIVLRITLVDIVEGPAEWNGDAPSVRHQTRAAPQFLLNISVQAFLFTKLK